MPFLLLPIYVGAAWLPVQLLAGKNPSAFGIRGWPMTSLAATALYSALTLGVVWLLVMRDRDRGPRWLRWLWLPSWVCPLGCVGVFAAALHVYLLWVGHYAPVTDRATALQIGFDLLREGENPYSGQTQLGNPIAPMLGGIVLAGGFITVTGSLYWYGLTTLVVLMIAMVPLGGARAAFMVGGLLVFSPMIRMELYSQSDSWTNMVWLALVGALTHWVARRPTNGRWVWVALVAVGILFGLTLAYRYIYSPIAIPLAALMLRDAGLARTVTCAVPAAFVSLGLAIFPWLIAPGIYAPFLKADHADSATVPYFKPILVLTMLLIYGVGSLFVRSLSGVYGVSCAGTVAMVLLLVWAGDGWSSYEAVAYDGAALVLALLAAGCRWTDALLCRT